MKKRAHIKLNNKKKQVASECHLINGPHHNQKALVNLRKFPKNCSKDDIKSMLMKYNFYDCGRNEKGNFDNDLKSKTINNNKVIISHSTGLMWHQSGSIEPMEWYNEDEWISELNGNAYAGYSDWSLPTVEEAASLLKARESNMDLFIDPYFSNQQANIWTCDSHGMYLTWKVRFTYGHVYLQYASCDIYFRPVRSCK
jgi:Protein of unknown function (DUF1566).